VKQVNEIQPTKVAVVFDVKPSDLQEASPRSKAAYWGLELLLSKGVQNKIHPSSICLWHNELLERGVSRVTNVAVSQLKHTRINCHISSSSDPVIILNLGEYIGVDTGQSCGGGNSFPLLQCIVIQLQSVWCEVCIITND